MPVHHNGHGDKNRSRGSSSIRGGMDAEFKVSKSRGVVTFECKKMKDDEESEVIKFDLKSVTIGEDEDGKPITAPILEKSTTFFTADKSATLNPTDQLTLDILSQLSGADGTPVSKADWMAACIEKYTVSSSPEKALQAKSKKFYRCMKSILDKGVVVEVNGCFTVVDPNATIDEIDNDD